jgi:hypothetical protein
MRNIQKQSYDKRRRGGHHPATEERYQNRDDAASQYVDYLPVELYRPHVAEPPQKRSVCPPGEENGDKQNPRAQHKGQLDV